MKAENTPSLIAQGTQTHHTQILRVIFDTILPHRDLPAFRGAMAERVGLEHEWFHNHNNDDSEQRYHYRYSLIQYKLSGHQPMLVCIDQGVEAARMFFDRPDWEILMKGQIRHMMINELHLKKCPLSIEDDICHTYALYDWQALNQDNYRHYQQLEGLMEIIDFLQPKLVAHILAFCKGIGWYVDREVKVEITEMYPSRTANYKGINPTLFNFAFRTNILLPDNIGLGKGVSLGFGKIRQKRQRTNRN